MKTLRTDQTEVINKLRTAMHHTKRAIASGPTGVGKTVIMSDIVNRAQEKDKKVLITVPAISLVDQTVITLAAQGAKDIGVIQADHHMTDFSKPVQVCSVQTLQYRWREGKMPKADLVLVDEVHRRFQLFSDWMPHPDWINVPFIGFSATPWSKGLGVLYDTMVQAASMRWLIDNKVLVPFRTFAPDMPDLSDVSVSLGDFVAADLDEVMRPKKLVANIVKTWKEIAINRPTVCFACSRAHADQLCKEFNEAGVGAGYLDCESSLPERDEMRKRMLAGEIKVLCNVDIIGLGVDYPEISCIVYARPTMSDIRFVQNIGRGLRAAPGKEDLLILDHSTTTSRLGFIDQIYEYHPTLDDGKTRPKDEPQILLPKECPACHLLKPPRVAKCPHCGHMVEAHANPVPVERGTLREITPDTEAPMAKMRKHLPNKAHVYGQLIWYARRKGYKDGWAFHKYKEIYDVNWPGNALEWEDKISAPVPELMLVIKWLAENTSKEWAKKRSRERWANGHAEREARKNGHMNGNGHDNGALSDRDQAVVNRAAQHVNNSLMTEDDWRDFK